MPVYSPIMLALCSMLLVTYYASNYAGIISLGLDAIDNLSVHVFHYTLGRVRLIWQYSSLKI